MRLTRIPSLAALVVLMGCPSKNVDTDTDADSDADTDADSDADTDAAHLPG